jgi:hypothetical protein
MTRCAIPVRTLRRAWWLVGLVVFLLLGPHRGTWALGLTHLTIAVGTASTVVLPASGTRIYLLLVNDSDTKMYCSLNGSAAALNTGLTLASNGGWILFDVEPSVPRTAINCLQTGTGTKQLLVTQVD